MHKSALTKLPLQYFLQLLQCGWASRQLQIALTLSSSYKDSFLSLQNIVKGGFFSESVRKFFQISKSKKKIFQKNYPEFEI